MDTECLCVVTQGPTVPARGWIVSVRILLITSRGETTACLQTGTTSTSPQVPVTVSWYEQQTSALYVHCYGRLCLYWAVVSMNGCKCVLNCVQLPEHLEAAGLGSGLVSDGRDDSHPAVPALLRGHLRAGGRAD